MRLTGRARRIALVLLVMVLAGIECWYLRFHQTPPPSDFAQSWAAARAWRTGGNPYDAVGPGRSFDWQFPLLYPLTAVLAAIPFSYLPMAWADVVFVCFGTGALAWAFSGDQRLDRRIFFVASISFYYLVQTSQWSALVTASVFVPALSPLWVCKPTIGAALLTAFPSRRRLIAGAALTLVTLILKPDWPLLWLSAMRSAPHIAPLIFQLPFGPLVLLCLLRWRLPEARLVAALACVPQTPLLYEALPLFAVVRTSLEAAGLALLSYMAWFWWQMSGPYGSYEVAMAASARAMVLWIYLPATAFVLTRKAVGTASDDSDAAATAPARAEQLT